MACGSLLRSVSCEDTQLHNELSMSKTFQSKEFVVLSLTNNRIVLRFWGLGATGVRSKVWVLTIRVLEVNPERDSVRDGP